MTSLWARWTSLVTSVVGADVVEKRCSDGVLDLVAVDSLGDNPWDVLVAGYESIGEEGVSVL